MARSTDSRVTRRRLLQGAAGTAALAIAFPMLNFASFRAFADSPRTYSARAVGLVERTLVIDMLAVLKIDFRPEAYADPLTQAEVAQFRGSGITGFNNAIGTGGPQVARKRSASSPAGWGSRHATRTCSASWTRPPTSTAPRPPASARSSWASRTPRTSASRRTSRRSTSSASAVPSSPTTARTSSAAAAPIAWTAASATSAPRSSRP